MNNSRNELKLEIINFLKTIGVKEREKIIKALEVIKSAAWESWDVTKDAEIRKAYKKYLTEIPVQEHKEFNPIIARSFGSKYYLQIKEFVKKYEQVLREEWAEEEALENQQESELDKQRRLYFHDDYEYETIPGEVIVYEDCIEVQAFGWQEGLQEKLPLGGDYQGKGRWKYPITMKDVFTRGTYFLEMPVLYVKP